MKLQIESTRVLTEVDGVPVRIWRGTTPKGRPCDVFVHRVAAIDDAAQSEIFQNLSETHEPEEKPATLAELIGSDDRPIDGPPVYAAVAELMRADLFALDQHELFELVRGLISVASLIGITARRQYAEQATEFTATAVRYAVEWLDRHNGRYASTASSVVAGPIIVARLRELCPNQQAGHVLTDTPCLICQRKLAFSRDRLAEVAKQHPRTSTLCEMCASVVHVYRLAHDQTLEVIHSPTEPRTPARVGERRF